MEKKAQTFTEALDMISKHMPGKHDQSTHGHKGGAAGAITGEGLKKHAAEMAQVVDAACMREDIDTTSERVLKAIGDDLKDNKDFDKVVSTIRKGHKERLEAAHGELTEAHKKELRESVVSDLIHQWNSTSGDSEPLSVAMQQAAMSEFKIKNTGLFNSNQRTIDKATNDYGDIQPGLKAFMRSQYNYTQSYLKEQGIKEMVVYRGSKWNEENAPAGIEFNGKPNKAQVQLQPLSSFSTEMGVALMFSGTKQKNLITATKIPAKDIMSMGMTGMGTKFEAEAVVFGGKKEAWTYAWDTKIHSKPKDTEAYDLIAEASSLK